MTSLGTTENGPTVSIGGTSTTNSGMVQQKDTTYTKIFVGGLPYHTTDESLRKYFDGFGEIEEAVVITDRQSGKSRGYGFVTMKRPEDAFNAIKEPNPCIDGRKANVNLAVIGAKPRSIPGASHIPPERRLKAGAGISRLKGQSTRLTLARATNGLSVEPSSVTTNSHPLASQLQALALARFQAGLLPGHGTSGLGALSHASTPAYYPAVVTPSGLMALSGHQTAALSAAANHGVGNTTAANAAAAAQLVDYATAAAAYPYTAAATNYPVVSEPTHAATAAYQLTQAAYLPQYATYAFQQPLAAAAAAAAAANPQLTAAAAAAANQAAATAYLPTGAAQLAAAQSSDRAQ